MIVDVGDCGNGYVLCFSSSPYSDVAYLISMYSDDTALNSRGRGMKNRESLSLDNK